MTANRLATLLGLVAWTVVSGQADILRDPSEAFPSGETLVFEVRWDPPAWLFFLPTISAGDLTIEFHHEPASEGRRAFKIVARALSSGFLPKLTGITVDDYFESTVSPQPFCSCKLTKRLREGKRHRDVYLTFDYKHRQGRYVMYDAAETPPAQLKSEEIKDLPKCVQDVLSGIYLTRLRQLQVGREFPMTLSDNGTVKQVETKVTKKEPVEAIAGSFSALKVETVSSFGGLFKGGGTLVVWFSADDRQIPVKFEAKVKLGKIFGTLKKMDY